MMAQKKWFGTAFVALAAAVSGGVELSNLQGAIASENEIHWGYTGDEGPGNWGSLSPDYAQCQSGNHQSPINLNGAIAADLSEFQIDYAEVPLKILNNGHTIQVNAESGNTLTLDGTVFELLQFHFHHPSEHTVNGQSYPMEIHFVHRNEETGELAVLGVLVEEGEENMALKSVWDYLPSRMRPEMEISDTAIDLEAILPESRSTYRYFGSLTTPPCSEVVRWVVFQEAIELSSSQIEAFSQIFPLNARPVQPLNQRFLLEPTFGPQTVTW